jgi:hypothetical protein
VASAIFDSLYALVLAGQVAAALQEPRAFIADHLVTSVWAFLIGGVIVPYVVAWLFYGRVPFLSGIAELWNGTIRPSLTRSQEASDTPTAWDYGNKAVSEGWVRVRIAEGVWVGGVFDERARFSTYPESRDLFISEQWTMSEAGEFTSPVEGTQGVWLAIVDTYVVEWLHDEGEGHVITG